MLRAIISGTGLYTPPYAISNDELVNSFNKYVEEYNELNADLIKEGKVSQLQPSSVEFIEKASGIKSRYVMNKDPILDTNTMRPLDLERSIEEDSVQCEMSYNAALQAINSAGIKPNNINAIICACSNMPRAYPALSIEIQNKLGIEECFSFDLNVACASAAFALNLAHTYILNGTATNVLIVNPEICSAHLNFRDRDSHFIFGDACTAIVVQREDFARSANAFSIIDSKLKTKYSKNIYNNHGFLGLTNTDERPLAEKYFVQEGRKVFKDIVPMVSEFLVEHVNQSNLKTDEIKRLWLHQANINMNNFIGKKILGYEASFEQAPIILDEYANTSSAGSIIAFHKYNKDLSIGDRGIISAFGAGYSAGSVIVEKV